MPAESDVPMLSGLLIALGVPVATLPCWPRLESFGQVVNVFKHGDGSSLNKLKQSAPEYFGPWHLPYGVSLDIENYCTLRPFLISVGDVLET
ncbi:hypothetical protein ACP3TG_23870 [Phytobacter diazotrophicus]